MATDPNQQNVRISEIDSSIPKWASEDTAEKILNAIKNGDSSLFKAATSQVNMTGNMTLLLGKLVALMGGDKTAAKNFNDTVKKMQAEQASLRRELANLDSGIKTVADNTNPSNIPPDPEKKKSNKLSEAQLNQIKSLTIFERIKSRMDLQGLKTEKEQLRALHGLIDGIDLTNAQLKENMPEIIKKLGLSSNVVEGNDPLGGLMAFVGKGNLLKNAMDTAVGLYSASQVPFEMIMQQVKDRFEITTELRQSGLLEDLSATFVDTTKAFSDNNMTIQEATQFVREFSNAVGVMGTNSALQFVNKMAYSTDMMDRFGLNFSQVAKISGTYLDTLERTGMLEQISASERDRGMKSFMEAVEGVSMTLKTSLEESARMIKEYLSRDDVAAMLMTNMDNLSQEVVANIGAMSKMGPMGEIIAKGAIDPARFALTQEYQALNNPALSGIRSIVDQMMLELRSGRGSDELIAQYGQQMSEILKNDPLVGQLVAMDDSVAKIVAGVGQLAQTSQDATNNILIPSVDQAERRRQDMERLRSKTVEATLASVIKTLDNSRALEGILNDQTKIIETQIEAIDTLSRNAADFMATLVSAGAAANVMLNQTIADFAKGVADLFPEHHMTGQYQELSETATTYEEQQRIAADEIGSRLPENRRAEIDQKIDDTSYGTLLRPEYFEIGKADERIEALKKLKDEMQTEAEKAYIDTVIATEQMKMAQKTISQYATDIESTFGDFRDESFQDLTEAAQGKPYDPMSGAEFYEQDQAKAILRESAPDVIKSRLGEVITVVNDMEGVSDEVKNTLLKQEAVNSMRATYISPEEMTSIIEEMFTDTELTSKLGDAADEFKSVLLSDLPDISDLGVLTDKLKSDQEFIKLTGNNTDKILSAIDEKIATNPNMSPDSLLALMRLDPSFTQMTDGNADAIITAIENKLTPSEIVVNPTPVTVEPPVVNVEPPTETITVDMPVDPSLMTALQLERTELANDSISSEIYGKIEESLGDSTDNQFGVTEFNDFVKELQDDRNLTKNQMLDILTKIEETISKNRPQVEEISGSTDVSRLVGSLGLLINELKGN